MKTIEQMLMDRIEEIQSEKRKLQEELELKTEQLLEALAKLEKYE